MTEALKELDRFALGATFICDEDSNLMGIITDGDIRHSVARLQTVAGLKVEDIMTKDPEISRRGNSGIRRP